MAFHDLHGEVIDLDALITALPAGETRTALQAAMDRLLKQLDLAGFNELGAIIQRHRAGVA